MSYLIKRVMGRVLPVVLLAVLLATGVPENLFASGGQSVLYVIPIEGEIEDALAQILERSYKEAEEMGGKAVILEISTPGGNVTSARNIRKIIENAAVPSIAFVKEGGALSAGAYIALVCEKIAMIPGSTIGDVEPRVGSERADEKFLSAWTAEMAALAEARGRDPDIARAMVDRDYVLEGVSEEGKLLTLTAQQAFEYGYADYIAEDVFALQNALGYESIPLRRIEPSSLEQIARVLTRSYVAPFLLMIGLAGIIIGVLTTGFGVAGLLGVVSLCLYFGGYYIAGFTGWAMFLLVLLGVVLLVAEAFIPGFGVFGVAGILCLTASIILAAPTWQMGIQSLAIAVIGTVILVPISFQFLSKRKFFGKLTLNLSYKKEEGYVSQKQDYSVYIGKKGKALTPLRPAGSVILEDNTRLDVVTQGDFIPKNTDVVVMEAVGSRIVVKVIGQ